MLGIDTNILLRFLVGDNAKQLKKIERMFAEEFMAGRSV